MTDPSDHKQTVRRAFTKQADAYAATASVSDPERIARLVEATDVDSSDRVLEVATAPVTWRSASPIAVSRWSE